MSGGLAAFGAVTAWRIRKRHPDYREQWLAAAGRTGRAEGGPVPVRTQTEADLEAAPWGLLAWEDPFADDGPASPPSGQTPRYTAERRAGIAPSGCGRYRSIKAATFWPTLSAAASISRSPRWA